MDMGQWSWCIVEKDGTVNDALSDQFVLEGDANGCLIKVNDENIPAAGTYYLRATARYYYTSLGQSLSDQITAMVKFTVKGTLLSKLKASATLKAAGSIDVIRPETAVTVTPTIKNLFVYTLDASSLGIYTLENKVYTPCDAFDVSYDGGTFSVRAAGELSTSSKYYAKLKVNDLLESGYVAIPVKMGTAKITSGEKNVTLLLKDRYSRGMVRLGTADASLSGIRDVTLDAASQQWFSLTELGNGEYAVGYKDNLIPVGFKSGTKKTVKLNVFLEGNTSAKPNATILTGIATYPDSRRSLTFNLA
jgi:hypothetical protein